jgi:lysozyme family protein
MAQSRERESLAKVLAHEGGYVDHPADPGGPTNKGIIQRVYDGYRRNKGLVERSVRLITDAEVTDIYRRQYANKIRFDELPAGVDFVVFDAAVNSGPSQAAKWLQRALRMNQVDGDLSEATVAAVNTYPDHDALIADFCARRLGMLQHLKTWSDFGKGWGARVANVLQTGQAWASGSVGPQPVAVHEQYGDAKALVADVELPQYSAEAATQTTLGGGGIAASVQTAQSQLQPLVGSNKTVDLLFTVLTVVSIGVALGGAAYALYAARKRKQAERAWSGEAIGDLDPFMSKARAAA